MIIIIIIIFYRVRILDIKICIDRPTQTETYTHNAGAQVRAAHAHTRTHIVPLSPLYHPCNITLRINLQFINRSKPVTVFQQTIVLYKIHRDFQK